MKELNEEEEAWGREKKVEAARHKKFFAKQRNLKSLMFYIHFTWAQRVSSFCFK